MNAKMAAEDMLRLLLANVVAPRCPGQSGLRVILENAGIAEKDGRPGRIEAGRATVVVDVNGMTTRFDFDPFSPLRSPSPLSLTVEE